MKERVNFVLGWERRWNEARGRPVDMAERCRKFGVSRPTGYARVKRFREASHDLRAVEEKSRRPLSPPQAVAPEVKDWIVRARKAMPRRGPRKPFAATAAGRLSRLRAGESGVRDLRWPPLPTPTP